MTDVYNQMQLIDDQIFKYAAAEGPALVKVWKEGKTDPGWGMPSFMEKYSKGHFRPAPTLAGAEARKWAFAVVMRSVRLVCIDIDGKNGGLTHAGKLGMLPLTLAETSKSGDGYHLFYATSEDEWGPEGFAMFSDRIGLEQGVDLRATGCVYHYPQQRWNGRTIAELPRHLKDRLHTHIQKSAAQVDFIIKLLDAGDPEEVLLMQTTLEDDLAKPIPAGRRNNTLFAIGTKLKLANVAGWEDKLFDRAVAVGLDRAEATKLVNNVHKYGV
jgi:hypothetical protein